MKELRKENQQFKKELKKLKNRPRSSAISLENDENTPQNYSHQGSNRSNKVSESVTQAGSIQKELRDPSAKQSRFLISKESKNIDQDGL